MRIPDYAASSIAGVKRRTPDIIVLDNALRLYHDARLLHSHDRFGSATALAVLAIEEFGKFLEHIGMQTPQSETKILHLRKQSVAATFFLNVAYHLSILKVFSIQLIGIEGKQMMIPKDDYVKIRPYLYKEEAQMDMDIFQKIIETEPFSNALTLFVRFYNGDLNRLKNRALYVDLAPDGAVQTDPFAIDEETSNSLLAAMRELLDAFNSILKSPSWDYQTNKLQIADS